VSPEARVGLAALLGFVLLFAMVIFIRGTDLFRPPGYGITIVFKDAAGIDTGTPVRMSGVNVGKVLGVELSQNNEALVRIGIDSGVDIPQGSRFTIATQGLLGERYLSITPASPQAPSLPPDSIVRGDDPFTVERLAKRFEEVADRVSTLVENANELVTDPELRGDLKLALRNARDAAAIARQTLTDAREVIGITRRAALNVEQTTVQVQSLINDDAAEISQNLRRMSQTMVDTSQRLQRFIEDTTGDGTLTRDVQATAASLRDASQRIRQMAEDLQGVINKDTAQEARETVREARAVVQRAGSFLGRFEGAGGPGGFSLRNFAGVEYQVWYSGQRTGHNLDLTLLPSAARFYRLGLHDIGAANSLVLQVGGRFTPSLLWRAGVFESQVGVGLDYQVTNPLWISLDLYNANQITLDAVGKYHVTPNWRITLGGRNLLRQPGLVFGVGTNF
jgi:phospholipid/cholesterol/gamma-HCH transport system substrate-binding protein